MTVRACVLALAVALGATLLAQQPELAPAPPQEPPAATFRTAIEAVQVDVFVTGEDGQPVPGLTIDDFEIFENGRPQPIATFDAVDIPLHDPAAVEPPLAEPDVLSNTGPAGRVYMFAFDEVSPCNALRTRHFLRQFMDRHFGPNDVAAVTLLGRGLVTDGQDFTGNRRLILQAIDKFSGGFPSFDEDCGRPSRSEARQLMASLRDLTEMMARVEGRHKSMLFISEGITYNVFDVIDYRGGVLSLVGVDAHAAVRAATRSNLTIYPIDPTGVSPDFRPLDDRSSLTALAEATGGFALYDSNSYAPTFERIVRESSTYYMLGFNSSYSKNDGRFVRIEVKVKRPGLKVHARDGYVAPTRDERRAEQRARVERSPIAEAIASPLATRGLGMHVSAAAYRTAKKESAVSLVMELDPSSLALVDEGGRFTGVVEARYLATDARNRIYPESRVAATLALMPDTYRKVAAKGVRIVSQLELPKGRYQIRVATGSGRNTGSVVYDLDIPDFRDPLLTMSGISLAATPADEVLTMRADRRSTGASKKCRPPSCESTVSETGGIALWSAATAPGDAHLLQDVLPEPPTTAREFDADQTLALFAEVYDNRRQGANAPASPIRMVASIQDASGQQVHSVMEERQASAPRRASGGHGFMMRVPLQSVPAGSYVLRVEASSGDDDQPLTASRRIPIRVR